MEMTYVDSSNIDQIGYDETLGECHVIFKNGRHYVYTAVSTEAWESFRGAESHGKYLNTEFKAKGYDFREV